MSLSDSQVFFDDLDFIADIYREDLLIIFRTNIFFKYCENIIINDADCSPGQISFLLLNCDTNGNLRHSCSLPCELRNKLNQINLDSLYYQGKVSSENIVNLIAENILLYNTLRLYCS